MEGIAKKGFSPCSNFAHKQRSQIMIGYPLQVPVIYFLFLSLYFYLLSGIPIKQNRSKTAGVQFCGEGNTCLLLGGVEIFPIVENMLGCKFWKRGKKEKVGKSQPSPLFRWTILKGKQQMKRAIQ